MIYESFILELWYLHCEDLHGLISNHLFQTTQEQGD